uniref:Methyltransferase type 12 domain-containing protein n=1 Tax=Mucochytrium quahogii TaxID=96639 RepID=A0A7S2RR34_9STRA|mmetsp:Transcript_10332/g.16866  ORF Transcript_10332/g.16866 Transcript_10332/m.16866 type:complete len:292 (+) Transcript_10332:159-1034(+)|eukprot:CAMPEP_0203759706 /NCGR_PEP_ID=MMETSP0098-20131031/12836_1 /ASSEMBLY_ACC=CAM_ASM_000208 /TAXON_ID=96639 /ORGANISM=" , Strain NY0313808BC1" /LENGTH=291 /DNA_ID=CAMNT_0050652849 /DNA_START=29 /DNA_END=904 /DNA_ORIENTATION=-
MKARAGVRYLNATGRRWLAGPSFSTQAMAADPMVRADGTKPTGNKMGFQMATISPVYRDWVNGDDGSNPIADVGCAFGINSIAAAQAGHQVVAVDMTDENFANIEQEIAAKGIQEKVCTRLGALPDDLSALENGYYSSILVAEVLHFLRGSEIKPALDTLSEKLVPGGTLAMTVVSRRKFLDSLGGPVKERIEQRMEAGEKYPGELENYDKLIMERLKDNDANFCDWKDRLECMPSLFHLFLREEWNGPGGFLENTHFGIKFCDYIHHPGYPSSYRPLKNHCIGIVLQKQV